VYDTCTYARTRAHGDDRNETVRQRAWGRDGDRDAAR
jgi:hypothetical protein